MALIGPSTERFLNQHLKLHQKETIKTIHQQKSTYSHCDLSLCLKSVKVIQDRDRKQEDKLIQSTKRQLKRVLMFQLTVPFFLHKNNNNIYETTRATAEILVFVIFCGVDYNITHFVNRRTYVVLCSL